MSPLLFGSVLVEKVLKSANCPKSRKVRFLVSDCNRAASASKFARFPPKTGSRRSALKSLRLPARQARHRLSPLCHRFLVAKVRKSGPSSRAPESQPAELPLRPAPFLVQKALKTVSSEEFVFPCRTASGMPEPQVSLVFGRKQAPDDHFAQGSALTGEFQPAEVVTASSPLRPLRHRSLWGRKVRKRSGESAAELQTLRAHGFSQRPWWATLDQPDRKATTFITSHFYLDDFAQSSEDPNPQPLQHTPLRAIPEEGFRTPAEATDEDWPGCAKAKETALARTTLQETPRPTR